MKTSTALTQAVVIDENTVLMPPGDYWLGDPCYFVPDKRWMEWLELADYEHEHNLFAYLGGPGGFPVLGFGTAYGDGQYRGSDGYLYGVDAGLIGLVPVALATEVTDGTVLGTRVHFDKPTLCTNTPETKGTGWFAGRTHGLMKFGDVEIDTRDWADDEDEEEA